MLSSFDEIRHLNGVLQKEREKKEQTGDKPYKITLLIFDYLSVPQHDMNIFTALGDQSYSFS